MALSKADREELDAYKKALRDEMLNEMKAKNQAQAASPVIPETPELEFPDVIRMIIQYSRFPTEAMQIRCLDAVDRYFAEPDEDEADESEPEGQVV